MNLRALQVFCDIASWRSFSRAADENGISQSGASQIVQQLEERLGVQLIDRSKRPLVLTAAGQVYYDGCRQLVQSLEALEEEVRTLEQEVSGRVKVAAIYSAGLSQLNGFVRQFLTLHPKANVRVQYEHPERVSQLVEMDLCDLGLISFPRSTRTIEATLWREEPMALVCAPSNPLATASSVSFADLAGSKLVAFDSDLQIRQATDQVLAERGVSVEIVMEFDNIETIKRAVEIDAGVALLPAPTVVREEQLGALRVLPLRDGEGFTRPLGLIKRRGKTLGRTARRFQQLLLEPPESKPAAAARPAETAVAAAAS